ncbi:MAG TPA: phosphate ABC transporter substrate-binding/OmpA family protein [Bryobacteraceae bacterium]|jgi:phosphate transport system substrate-binding protein
MDRTGRCVNFGNCTLANQKQTIVMPSGLELKCPECGRTLVEITAQRSSSAGPTVVFAVALALLAAAGWFLWNSTHRSGSGGVDRTDSAPTSVPASSPGAGAPMLRLHGSNTIGEQLGPELAAAFLKSQGAQDVKILRDSPELIRVTGDGGSKLISIEARGSSTAFADLAAGKCDIGMASRPVKPGESTATTGDLTLPSAEHVLGLDGVAVIVNQNNPVEALSREQLSKIFAGVTTDWAQVGGKAGPIAIYARDAKSGTFDTFRTLVLGARDLAAGAQRFEDSALLADKVAGDPGGIGFVGLPYVRSAKAVAVSDKGSRALAPNRLTIATEDYLLARRLFLYDNANNTSQNVNWFIEFAIGKDGQDVVEKAGFVSQSVRAAAPVAVVAPAADSPDPYKKIIANAERLTLDYRFKAGASALDNKAVVDLGRLVDFLSALHYTGADLYLLGFADATGDPAVNLRLSKERAQAVAEQIERRGVKPGVITGFGDAMPVADNATDDGRQKNRRVEVWVKKR